MTGADQSLPVQETSFECNATLIEEFVKEFCESIARLPSLS